MNTEHLPLKTDRLPKRPLGPTAIGMLIGVALVASFAMLPRQEAPSETYSLVHASQRDLFVIDHGLSASDCMAVRSYAASTHSYMEDDLACMPDSQMAPWRDNPDTYTVDELERYAEALAAVESVDP